MTSTSPTFATNEGVINFLGKCPDDNVGALLLQRGDLILQAEYDRTARIDAKGNMLLTAGSVAVAFAVTLPAGLARSGAILFLLTSVLVAVLSQLAWPVKGWSIHDWMAPTAPLDNARIRSLQYVISQVDQLRDRRHSNGLKGRLVQLSQICLTMGIAWLAASVLWP
jgi:hypothetical protein